MSLKELIPIHVAAEETIDSLASKLGTSLKNGLTDQEYTKKVEKNGKNELTEKEEESLIQKYFDQFKQPLVLMLLASALISIIIGQYDDALSITLAIVIVCTVAFIQEYRSEQALEALKSLVKHKCKVYRNGQLLELISSEVVPGDIVSLSIGDRVPADIRIFKSVDLYISEAELTGESNPVEKISEELKVDHKEKDLRQYTNLAFMGTLVHGGNARGLVYATGDQTEIGKMAIELEEAEEKKTPLQESMDELGEKLSYISIGVIAIIFLLGVYNGHKWFNMFILGVAMAVAAIPEGLPIVTTVTLAMGVIRMSRRNAIVKKLPSVETLGCTNIICTDKTGTLTMNQMTVKKIFTLKDKNIYEVSGHGLETKGSFSNNGKNIEVKEDKTLLRLLEIGYLCNNSKTIEEKYVGDPTEVSLLIAAKKGGLNNEFISNYSRKEEISFSSKTKWMGVKVENKTTKESNYYVKGAIEVLLPKCSTYHSDNEIKQLTKEDVQYIENVAYKIGSEGIRVLILTQGKDVKELTFVGLVGIYDPPRPGVKEAIKSLSNHGVRTIMMTGDAKVTALSIAKELGIYKDEYLLALSPDEIDHDAKLQDLSKVSVFYRMTPHHKKVIVEALQAQNNIVGMTGDGVNDAIALKLADIGIAMGSGTDVCKEASKMVLVDDNFATINAAIEEGKAIFSGIKNFLRFQLTTSISALSIISISNLLGYPPPLNPMQILWINIIMDGPPAQTLGVEPVDPDIVHQPPRNPKDSVVSKRIITGVVLNALIMIIGTLFIYLREISHDGILTKRDTTMTFTTFLMFQMFNAMNCRSEKKSIFKIGFFSNKPFLIAVTLCILGQLSLVYVSFMRKIFDTDYLTLFDMFTTILIGSTVFIFEEVLKFLKIYS